MNQNNFANCLLLTAAAGSFAFALNSFYFRHLLGSFDFLIVSVPIIVLVGSLGFYYTRAAPLQQLALPVAIKQQILDPGIVERQTNAESRLDKIEALLKENGISERKREPSIDSDIQDEREYQELETAIELQKG